MFKMPHWPTYSDFYRNSSYSKFLQEHRTFQNEIGFQMIWVDQSGHNYVDPSVPEVIVALTVDTEDKCTCEWTTGNGWHQEHAEKDKIIVIPPYTESKWRVNGRRKLIILSIPVATFNIILSRNSLVNSFDPISSLSKSYLKDSFVISSMLKLWDCLKSTHPIDIILADNILKGIVLHLLKISNPEGLIKNSVFLPAWKIEKLKNYLKDRLHETIQVSDMAEIAELSPRQFTRAMNSEINVTPHKWLMGMRIEFAKILLKENYSSFEDIAQLCGFCNQSHLNKVFKSETGYTPRRWRLRENLKMKE